MSKVRSGFLLFLLQASFYAQAGLKLPPSDFEKSISSEQIQKVAGEREWLRLLHYRGRLTGQVHSILKGPGYFLSDEGAENPQAELQASVDILFGKSPERQCQYLARTDFIVRQWPALSVKVVKCAFFENWKDRLGAKKVSLIFATSYLNSAASSFGHTFLRLENPKNILRGELLDYGINFAARTEDSTGALYVWKGLLGFFPGSFAMLPYHQLIKEYTNLEGRDLWEYQLNLTEVEVERLLKYLFEMEKTYIDYYFLDDNCSYQVLWALQVARPALDLAHDDELSMIPLDTVKLIERAQLIDSKKYRPSLRRQWQTRLKDLSSDEKNQLQLVLKKMNEKADGVVPSEVPTVIEAAQVYTDLQVDLPLDQRKQRSFQLSHYRARLPKASELKIPTPPVSPEQTPDSSSLGLSLGRQNAEPYQALHIDPTFHDWLSDDTGVSPFSELKVFNFEFRNTAEQFRLEKATLLKILSTQAIDRFFQPLSWGIELSYSHYLLAPETDRPMARGQVGVSLDLFEGTRVMGFLYAGASRNLDKNASGIYGSEIRVLSKMDPRFRLGLQGRSEIQSSKGPLTEMMAEGTLDLYRTHLSQWELRGYYTAQRVQATVEDLGLSFYYNFILSGY